MRWHEISPATKLEMRQRHSRGLGVSAFVWWCRRNPAVTSLVGTVAVISVLAVSMALFVAKARKEAQLKAALQSNQLRCNGFSHKRGLAVAGFEPGPLG